MTSLINHPAIKTVLATETDIQAQVQRVANELTSKFAHNDKRPVFIAVLKGGVIFATDLLRKCHWMLTLTLSMSKVIQALLQLVKLKWSMT